MIGPTGRQHGGPKRPPGKPTLRKTRTMAEFDTMLDRVHRAQVNQQRKRDPKLPEAEVTGDQWQLPVSAVQAIARGMRGHCPSCGQTRLFYKFLKPIDQCDLCDQDWKPQQADDFPAYIAIILTGHIMAPIIIALASISTLPMWGNMVFILTLAILLMGSILQPAKGGVIAFQWWMGMHGFQGPKQLRAKMETDVTNMNERNAD